MFAPDCPQDDHARAHGGDTGAGSGASLAAGSADDDTPEAVVRRHLGLPANLAPQLACAVLA